MDDVRNIMEYAWNVHGVFMECVLNVKELCIYEYAICMEYVWRMHRIFVKCIEHLWNADGL